MTEIEKEARGYHILAACRVRGTGSKYTYHPNRCLWDICGKPCIQRVLEAVKGAKYIDKIAVLTESEEIEEVVKKIGEVVVIRQPLYGAHDCPRDFTQGQFKRNKPRSLLSVEQGVWTGGVDYLIYYLKESEGYEADIRFEFGANMPLITSKIINRMIEKFFIEKGASYISALYRIGENVHITNPTTGMPLILLSQPIGGLPKQLAPPLWMPAPCSVQGSFSQRIDGYAYNYIEITPEEGFDMHNEEDLFLANCYMKRRLLKEGEEVNWKIGQDYKHKVEKNRKKES